MIHFKKPTVPSEWEKRISGYLNEQVRLSFYPMVEAQLPEYHSLHGLCKTIDYIAKSMDSQDLNLPKYLVLFMEKEDFSPLQNSQRDKVLVIEHIARCEHLHPKQKYSVKKVLKSMDPTIISQIKGAIFVSEEFFNGISSDDFVERYVLLFTQVQGLFGVKVQLQTFKS